MLVLVSQITLFIFDSVDVGCSQAGNFADKSYMELVYIRPKCISSLVKSEIQLTTAAKIQKKTNALGSDIPSNVVSEYDTTYSYALVVSSAPCRH